MFKELTDDLLDLAATASGHRNALYAVKVYLCCSCSCCWS
jgi:hypothetical protein